MVEFGFRGRNLLCTRSFHVSVLFHLFLHLLVTEMTPPWPAKQSASEKGTWLTKRAHVAWCLGFRGWGLGSRV